LAGGAMVVVICVSAAISSYAVIVIWLCCVSGECSFHKRGGAAYNSLRILARNCCSPTPEELAKGCNRAHPEWNGARYSCPGASAAGTTSTGATAAAGATGTSGAVSKVVSKLN